MVAVQVAFNAPFSTVIVEFAPLATLSLISVILSKENQKVVSIVLIYLGVTPLVLNAMGKDLLMHLLPNQIILSILTEKEQFPLMKIY